MGNWIWRMLVLSDWNIKLDKGKLINLGKLSRNMKFNSLSVTLGDDVKILLGWVLEAWRQ